MSLSLGTVPLHNQISQKHAYADFLRSNVSRACEFNSFVCECISCYSGAVDIFVACWHAYVFCFYGSVI